MKKRISVLLISAMLFTSLFAFSGCSARLYSEKEHLKRIAERVDARYMSGEYDFTSYKLYPIYNEKEECDFVLVEFEPQGFVFVEIADPSFPIFGHGMYMRNESYLERGWYKYKYIRLQGDETPEDYEDEVWKVIPTQKDMRNTEVTFCEYKDGERVVYYESPYKLAGVLDQRLYGIADRIPAIKTETGYLNLFYMEEFVYYDNFKNDYRQQYMIMAPPAPYKQFDL